MAANTFTGTGPHWTEGYRLLVLRDPEEEEDKQYLAVLLERNVVGQGGSIAEAIQDAQNQFIVDYDVQLGEGIPRPGNDPDPELIRCYRNRKVRETSDGEEVLMRLRAKVTIWFRSLRREKPIFPDINYKQPEPTFEFATAAVG